MKDSSRMATMPVFRLIVSMGLPSMLSMFVQALYNIVDSIFVSRLGESALTAVTLAFPIQMLAISVAVGTGVGLNSLISRRLGEGDRAAADRAASHGVVLGALSYALFAVFGLFFPRAFMDAFAENPATAAMGTDYLSVVCVFSMGVFIEVAIEKVLQATGNMIWPMVFMLVGAITNLILDPIMIFGLLGCPAMGVRGAAIATVIGQILSCIVAAVVMVTRSHEVRIRLRGFRFSAKTLRDIYAVGAPSIIMQSIGSVMIMGLNSILIAFSEAAVSVLGVYFKLQSFVFMPVFGLTHRVLPVIGYNYGARHKDRIREAIRSGAAIAVVIMAVGTLIFLVFAPQLMGIFNPSAAMMAIGVPALRIIGTCFVPAALAIILSTFYQAIGMGGKSLFISLMRQLFIILPLAWAFSRVGLWLVWYAFPIAEVVVLAVNFGIFSRVWQQKIVPLDAPAPGAPAAVQED